MAGPRDNTLRWSGTFADPDREREYRSSDWPVLIRQQGVVCGIASLVYLLAGIGPVMDQGFTPLVQFLTLFRGATAAVGLAAMYIARTSVRRKLYPLMLVLFILSIGVYEAVEAVLTYEPNLEYAAPFTLLLIFLMYMLFPLRLGFVLPPALVSSVLYVASLKLYAVPRWADIIQLSLFFVAVNALGAYMLIRQAKTLRRQHEAMDNILALNERMTEAILAKEAAFRRVEKLSITDTLTDVANRRRFMDVANEEWTRSERYNHPMSLIILDIDFFKKVNDTYGHAAGDQVLRELCRRLELGLRTSDLLARLGGEEFGVLLPETGLNKALEVADRLREGVAHHPMTTAEGNIPVTVSLGVAQRRPDDDSLDTLLKRADQALYDAKNGGRNRVLTG